MPVCLSMLQICQGGLCGSSQSDATQKVTKLVLRAALHGNHHGRDYCPSALQNSQDLVAKVVVVVPRHSMYFLPILAITADIIGFQALRPGNISICCASIVSVLKVFVI